MVREKREGVNSPATFLLRRQSHSTVTLILGLLIYILWFVLMVVYSKWVIEMLYFRYGNWCLMDYEPN